MTDTQAIPTQQAIPADQMNTAFASSAPAPQPAPIQGSAGPTPSSPIPTAPQGPTPIATKPLVDPRPYAWLAKNRPEDQKLVDQVASETGVSPQRIAAHWYAESGMRREVPDGKAGEVGAFQLMPQTAQRFNARGVLDPRQFADNMLLGARYMHSLDGKYGQDSWSSIAGYQGGEGSVNDIAAHPDRAWSDHPNTMSYAQKIAGGNAVDPKNFTGQSGMTPKGIVDAGTQGGPDGLLRYMAQTAPRGMPMGDVMRHAEATLVGWAAARGDYAGMQHARDFMLQMSHAGSNMNLMGAYQALQAGDGQSAAQYLARAHAFFPDGTVGQFGVDKSGAVWGVRYDENDPTRQLGPPVQVTPQDVAGLLNQTTDPGKFLQFAQEQQKTAADIRHQDAMGEYYSNLLSSREKIASEKAQAGEQNATTRANATITAAEIRAGRQGTGPAQQLAREADKEANSLFGDVGPYEQVPVEQRGIMGEIYTDVRMQGVSGPQSRAVVEGLTNGTLKAIRGQDGSFGVVSGKDQKPIAYLSPELGARLFGGGAPQALPTGPVPGAPSNPPGQSPIGASAGTPYARGANVSQNLTGTVMPPAQSSALPPQGQ